MIEIHYAIIRSSNPDKIPDPVVGLMGGPGVRSLDMRDFWVTLLGPALVDRDLVVLDQRGVGYSQPVMNCPEAEEPFYLLYAENLSMAEQNQRHCSHGASFQRGLAGQQAGAAHCDAGTSLASATRRSPDETG